MAFGALLGQNPSDGGGFTKDEILAPETPPIYNLDADATPNNMFQNIFAVGDIKVSTRTDLGDSWLLCNGETISPNDYPGLKDILPIEASPWEKYINTQGGSSRVSVVEKYFVRSDVVGSYQYIDLETGVKSEIIKYGTPQSPAFYAEMQHAGDYYIVFPRSSYSSVLYSKNINGPWAELKDLTPGRSVGAKFCAFDGENYYILVGSDDTQEIYYANSLEQETWTKVNAPVNYPMSMFGYVNGYWYAAASKGSYSNRYIYYTTDIKSGQWNSYVVPAEDVNPSAQTFNRSIGGIEYYNGKYYLRGQNKYHISDSISEFKTATTVSGVEMLYAVNGISVGLSTGVKKIFVSNKFPDGIQDHETTLDVSNLTFLLGYHNGWFYAFGLPSNDTHYWIYRKKLTEALWPKLPAISYTGAHAYIRGK